MAAKDWDKIQGWVYQYYVIDKMSLLRVIKKISEEQDFKAS